MSRMIFSWRRWGGVLLACGITVLAAFAIPVPRPEQGTRIGSREILPEELVEAEPEDLRAFLEIRRWRIRPPAAPGPSPPPPKPAEPAVRSVNPLLVEMGYVGLITTRGKHAVLLARPDGKVVRMVPGDTLPDGRILVSVTDNSLTLKTEGRPEEVLTLFPRARTDARSPESGSGGSGAGVPGGAAPRVSNKVGGSR